jgi:hypothetical protein
VSASGGVRTVSAFTEPSSAERSMNGGIVSGAEHGFTVQAVLLLTTICMQALRRIASFLAVCSPLIRLSPAVRICVFWIHTWKLGMPSAMRMPTMTTTTITSISETPAWSAGRMISRSPCG